MPQFPHNDKLWEEARQFLSQHSGPHSLILAPEPFTVTIPPVISYEAIAEFHPASFDHVLIHKGLTPQIGGANLKYWVVNYQPIFANAVFVMFTKRTNLLFDLESDHYKSLLGQLDELARLKENTSAEVDDATLNYWAAVSFLRTSCNLGTSILVPTPLRSMFEFAVDIQSFNFESLNTVDYVVLSIHSVEHIPITYLKRILADYKVIYSDNALGVYAKNYIKGLTAENVGLARTLSSSIDEAID
ncbi:MAG: hypothetical protein HOJ88_09970 [Proteobacteria bacterium]|nr:hypothetical protein [Pseudomonadota bacterium]